MELRVDDESARSYEEVMMIYDSAIKEINTKIEILSNEFQLNHKYNPIEHIKTRRKTSQSIVRKLKKHGYESSLSNMVKYIDDIAGVRVICSFKSDVYMIADLISSQDDIRVLAIKDYIEKPKESGYESYHMLVTVPVFLTEGIVETKVEIQIRTVAMDFWATLEHKIQYKYPGQVPADISGELFECAKMVSELDEKMQQLNQEIQEEPAAAK